MTAHRKGTFPSETCLIAKSLKSVACLSKQSAYYYPRWESIYIQMRMILIILVSLMVGCTSLADKYPQCVNSGPEGSDAFNECIDSEREYAYTEAKAKYLLCRRVYAQSGIVWHSKPHKASKRSGDGVPDSTLELTQEMTFNGCRP